MRLHLDFAERRLAEARVLLKRTDELDQSLLGDVLRKSRTALGEILQPQDRALLTEFSQSLEAHEDELKRIRVSVASIASGRGQCLKAERANCTRSEKDAGQPVRIRDGDATPRMLAHSERNANRRA